MEYVKCLKQSLLFKGVSSKDIEYLINSDDAEIVEYAKDEVIFNQGDTPKYLFVLLEGKIIVANNSRGGVRTVITTIKKCGEMFGDVYLFLGKEEYENYAQTAVSSKVLLIKKDFFLHCDKSDVLGKMTSNLLSAFANKAYYLNKRLQVTTMTGIKQRIAKVLIQHINENGNVPFSMSREDLASYIAVTRPSVSRELANMKKDGLIYVEGKNIIVKDRESILKLI